MEQLICFHLSYVAFFPNFLLVSANSGQRSNIQKALPFLIQPKWREALSCISRKMEGGRLASEPGKQCFLLEWAVYQPWTLIQTKTQSAQNRTKNHTGRVSVPHAHNNPRGTAFNSPCCALRATLIFLAWDLPCCNQGWICITIITVIALYHSSSS